MYLNEYFYVASDSQIDGNFYISDLSRKGYMNDNARRKYKELFKTIKPFVKSAFLYASGGNEHHSMAKDHETGLEKSIAVVKSQLGYIATNCAKEFEYPFSYMNINANACVSSQHSVYEAYQLLKNGFDSVVVFVEDFVDNSMLKFYKQLNIPVKCGDGIACALFSKEKSDTEVLSVDFIWKRESSPFTFTQDGYELLLKVHEDDEIEIIKGHLTGTKMNDEAELGAIKAVLGEDVEIVRYKDKIGHTQGACGLLEMLKVCEEKRGKILCLGAGLGNFYSSIKIQNS